MNPTIYIINLERAATRRRHMEEQLKRNGLEATFIQGIEGAGLSDQDLEELCDLQTIQKFPNWLSRGMIGAALSHRKALQTFIQSSAKFALILEDDVSFAETLPQFLRQLPDVSVRDDEVVLLHYTSFNEIVLRKEDGIDSVDRHFLCTPEKPEELGSGAAYLISRPAAESLFSWILPIRAAPDSWDRFLDDGALKRVRCVHPMPVSVIGAKSTIDISNQSKLRAVITDWIDRRKVPILHDFLRQARLRSIASRSNVRIVNDELE